MTDANYLELIALLRREGRHSGVWFADNLLLAADELEAAMGTRCEPMDPDEEGWSEWVHPLPGYLMQCCDCNLIHEMEFAIGKTQQKGGPFNSGESDRKGVVLFRARRHALAEMTALDDAMGDDWLTSPPVGKEVW